MSRLSAPVRRSGRNSFTLVELLTVMFIIVILSAITLAAAEGVMKSAARSRTRAEVVSMSTALENFKADNAIYPPFPFGGDTSTYKSSDGSGAGVYQNGSQLLFKSLSGKNAFNDGSFTAGKGYIQFKANQVGSPTGNTYLEDPFGYSYGYNTGDAIVSPATTQTMPPFNGTGFFDLWSTGGATSSQVTTTPALTNSWISNWAN